MARLLPEYEVAYSLHSCVQAPATSSLRPDVGSLGVHECLGDFEKELEAGQVGRHVNREGWDLSMVWHVQVEQVAFLEQALPRLASATVRLP